MRFIVEIEKIPRVIDIYQTDLGAYYGFQGTSVVHPTKFSYMNVVRFKDFCVENNWTFIGMVR